ncbi:MAG: ribonuclease Y [Caldisericum sp. CG2_30_36_11]|nr:ribonuclease Y [Caldisericota bacterium]OIP13668.1 MAG: ribonuclease Y [Caldisericum sp. CG2_30_36_11]PIP49718.1 MAG: ribonuclease Y [Caldiserica bacterium CG23_combo_of_CG06-09_8_20_14_all_35_60]
MYVIITILMFAFGFIMGLILQNYLNKTKIGSIDEYLKKRKEELEAEVQAEKREQRIQLKEEFEDKTVELEAKFKDKQKVVQETEGRLLKKEEILDRKMANVERKEKEVFERDEYLTKLKQDLEIKRKSIEGELLRIASLTMDEARNIVMKRVEAELEKEYSKKIVQMEEELKGQANEKAKVLLSQAMESCAINYVSETTVSVVPLPSDELKGRIIGREGRNIRTFETLTGVDILIDDTPEAVTLSSFDPMRREVARKALEKLIIDGRIHPARIEEFVQESENEVEQIIVKEADDALMNLSLYGFSTELKKIIGEMKFRTSYGQNLLQHSIEVAHIANIIASEIGENVTLATRAGLLHDIGKVAASEIEGPHAVIGSEILKKFGENELIVHAVKAHHNDVKPETVLDAIIQVADTLSATRPGARRENLDTYIKRMEALEKIASSISGVKKAFVVQAGREVRIIVNPEEIGEESAYKISHDIAKKIEEEVVYPGVIKITVVRETRYIDYAK